MEKFAESLKYFAGRLTRLSNSDDAVETLRRLRLAGLLGQVNKDAREEPARQQDGDDRVGIWERKKGTSSFVRCIDKLDEWNLWAPTGRIEPKGEARRIVLIGESVARGYLYDPQFNAAMALELLLKSQMGSGAIEVIDLARTNLGLAEENGSICQLILSALLLEPDAVIVFAGNNWTGQYSWNDLPSVEGALQEEGIPVLKRLAERRLSERIRDLFTRIAPEYESGKVPLLWMIPEFNLADWRDPVCNAPHMTEGKNRQWLTCLDAAGAALREGRLHEACDLVRRMSEIDQETNAAAFYILADCSRALGDPEAERVFLQKARDTFIWEGAMDMSPRRYGITRRMILEQAAQYKIPTIDLSETLREYLSEELPGRRMFLDYCHMTVEGLHVAMAAAASWILSELRMKDLPWRELLACEIAPSPSIQGEAAFLAALHNAHWYQSPEIVRYYCDEALRLAPDLSRAMIFFIEVQTDHAPMLLSQSGAKLAELNYPSIQHYLLRNPQSQQVDMMLIDAMVCALDGAGVRYSEKLSRLRIQERSVTRKPVDLMDSYYAASLFHPMERKWENPALPPFCKGNYYKAFWRESRFFFCAETQRPVRLDLTCRVPKCGPAERVVIRVNGNVEGEFPAVPEWANWEIAIPGSALRDGMNEVVIQWPIPEFGGKQELESIIKNIMLNIAPEFYARFGEIYSLTASDARTDVSGERLSRELRSVAVGH